MAVSNLIKWKNNVCFIDLNPNINNFNEPINQPFQQPQLHNPALSTEPAGVGWGTQTKSLTPRRSHAESKQNTPYKD